MKYIIMADGKGIRWNNYNNIPKHFIEINGEKIIERTIRLLKKYDSDSEIIITSHDNRYEFDGAKRYEPKNNVLEIDRFTEELIEDNICFLYGDTYYSDLSIKKIIESFNSEILFFGNSKSIVAIKITDCEIFKKHFYKVRNLFLKGEISSCVGWQVYQSYQNISFDKKVILNDFIVLENDTTDFNTPEEYNSKIKIGN